MVTYRYTLSQIAIAIHLNTWWLVWGRDYNRSSKYRKHYVKRKTEALIKYDRYMDESVEGLLYLDLTKKFQDQEPAITMETNFDEYD